MNGDLPSDLAGDVESFDGIAEQISLRINEGTRECYVSGFGHKTSSWQISPNIERAFGRRKTVPVVIEPKPTRKSKLKPAPVYEPATPAEIKNYDALIMLFRARANELQISRETIDDIASLPDRYASKVLSLNHLRRIGTERLGPILDALCLKLIAVPDEAALERNRSRLVPRNESQVRMRQC